jgi:hypothetical protein
VLIIDLLDRSLTTTVVDHRHITDSHTPRDTSARFLLSRDAPAIYTASQPAESIGTLTLPLFHCVIVAS